jgi:hypothetical protein
MTISSKILHRMGNESEKKVDKIKTQIFCLKIFSENRPVYEIKWKNTLKPEEPQMTSQHGAYILHAGKQSYVLIRACTRPRAGAPTLTRTQKYIILLFLAIIHELLSM